ncbi:hypothetical protein [Kamptonema formosum]|uniref:hypothetical protein n=1 Tax=Kamptonema formosum TaxID=331992 RepID=UPI0003470FBB|nr:hypothetical protein [Oscillatoria sp. PCC 10802]
MNFWKIDNGHPLMGPAGGASGMLPPAVLRSAVKWYNLALVAGAGSGAGRSPPGAGGGADKTCSAKCLH